MFVKAGVAEGGTATYTGRPVPWDRSRGQCLCAGWSGARWSCRVESGDEDRQLLDVPFIASQPQIGSQW